jgi:hypothetical protein
VKLECPENLIFSTNIVEPFLNEMYDGEIIFLFSKEFIKMYILEDDCRSETHFLNNELLKLYTSIVSLVKEETLDSELIEYIKRLEITSLAERTHFKYFQERFIISAIKTVGHLNIDLFFHLSASISHNRESYELFGALLEKKIKEQERNIKSEQLIYDSSKLNSGIEKSPNLSTSAIRIETALVTLCEYIISEPNTFALDFVPYNSLNIGTKTTIDIIEKANLEFEKHHDRQIKIWDEYQRIGARHFSEGIVLGCDDAIYHDYSDENNRGYTESEMEEYRKEALENDRQDQIINLYKNKDIWFESIMKILLLFSDLGIIDYTNYTDKISKIFGVESEKKYKSFFGEIYNPQINKNEKLETQASIISKHLNYEVPVKAGIISQFYLDNADNITQLEFNLVTKARLAALLHSFMLTPKLRQSILYYYNSCKLFTNYNYSLKNYNASNLFNEIILEVCGYLLQTNYKYWIFHERDYENSKYYKNIITNAVKKRKLKSKNGALLNLYFDGVANEELLNNDELSLDFNGDGKYINIKDYLFIKKTNEFLSKISADVNNIENIELVEKLHKENIIKFTFDEIEAEFESNASNFAKIMGKYYNPQNGKADFINDDSKEPKYSKSDAFFFVDNPQLFKTKTAQIDFITVDEYFRKEWRNRFDNFFLGGKLEEIIKQYYCE